MHLTLVIFQKLRDFFCKKISCMISVQIRLTALKFGIAVAFVKKRWWNRRYRRYRRLPFFFAIFRRIRQFWIIWDKLIFLKKIPLVFAFDTCNFSKTKRFFLQKNKLHDLGPNKTYSSEIWHSSSFCEEQHGTVKKRRRNRRYRRKPPSAAELDNSESFETNFFFEKL